MTTPDTQHSHLDNKKKWLMLSMVGAALLLIPRRSSRQAAPSADTPHINPDDKITK